MMDHLPAPCFSAIDIRDATLELPPLTGEGCLDAFHTYRVSSDILIHGNYDEPSN
jgi:hypothetical protein